MSPAGAAICWCLFVCISVVLNWRLTWTFFFFKFFKIFGFLSDGFRNCCDYWKEIHQFLTVDVSYGVVTRCLLIYSQFTIWSFVVDIVYLYRLVLRRFQENCRLNCSLMDSERQKLTNLQFNRFILWKLCLISRMIFQ